MKNTLFGLITVSVGTFLTPPATEAAVSLEPVDTIYVSARTITVTGRQSKDLVGLVYSRDNLYFNEPGAPRFLFFDKEGKVALGIGGSIKGTLHYDFDGSIDDGPYFTTYDIPVPGNPARRQAFGGDASHSTIFLRLVGRTTRFGYYSAYVQTQFSGKPTGSYNIRVKQAYMTLGALTAGLANSTFVDVGASVPLIDEQGPSGIMMRKQLLFRYNPRIDDHWSAGIAVELPSVSVTADSRCEKIAQRVPDIPAYIQYRWNGGRSHVRLSALLRTMSYRNLVTEKNHFANGWGLQLSGALKMPVNLTLLYQVVYGSGIGTYFNDLSGNGLDLVWSGSVAGRMVAPHSLGLVSGLKYSAGRFTASASWSLCRLYDQSQMGPDTYKRADYVSVNAFYNILDDLQAGLEYNWGERHNLNGDTGHANRISAMMQFTF